MVYVKPKQPLNVLWMRTLYIWLTLFKGWEVATGYFQTEKNMGQLYMKYSLNIKSCFLEYNADVNTMNLGKFSNVHDIATKIISILMVTP